MAPSRARFGGLDAASRGPTMPDTRRGVTPTSSRATTPYQAFVQLGSRLGRDTILYAVGTTLALPVGLVTTAVLTRNLSVGEFGELAVLLAFAGLLTIALNMVFLQGPLLLVFLSTDDGGAVDPDEAEAAARHERPIMLSTGLLVTVVIGLAGVLVAWLLSRPLASVLVGRSSAAGLVTLAGASAATGAVWRYVTNVTRFEKRAWSYAGWASARPIVALITTVPLILSGVGLGSALIGTATGSLVSAAGALWISRRSYALAVDRSMVGRAARRGRPWVIVVMGLYLAHSADLLLLRATSTNAQLGQYRIADALSQVISYGVSAFHLAQVPLDSTLMSQAAYDEHGRDRVMATYVLAYLVWALFLTLVLTTAGATAIAIIAPGYREAASYVPLTSLAYVAYGFLLAVFRGGDFFESRVRAYCWTAGSAGALVIVLALGGAQLLGVAGVPIGATLGCLLPAFALLALGHRARHPLPLDYRRCLGVLSLAIACWALQARVGHGDEALLLAVKLGSLACYPVGLVALRIVPPATARDLRSMVGAILPRRRDHSELVLRVFDLPDAQREALVALTRDRVSPPAAALRLGVAEPALLGSVVAGLRRLAGGSGEFPRDEELGRYLTSVEPPADRDAVLRELRRSSTDLAESSVMEQIYRQLRDLPRRAWGAALLSRHVPQRPAGVEDGATLEALARAGWSVDAAARELEFEPRELRARAIAELRRRGARGRPGPADQLMARFLLEPDGAPTPADLWAAGVDPIDLHQLELVLAQLRLARPAGRAQRRRVRAALRAIGRLALP